MLLVADGKGGGNPEEHPAYDWLYKLHQKHAAEEEATRPIPKAPRSAGPEETRVLPTLPPLEEAAQPGGPPPGGPAGAPPPGPAPAPPARRRRRRFGLLRLVLLVLLLWLVFLVAVPFWAWTRVERVDASPRGERPAEQPGTTYLIVGSDSRAGLSAAERRELGTGNVEGERTDTIMLLHVGSGPNLLMSIPRDSQVEIPGVGTDKVNAAYALQGPALLVQTLEQATGIRVDHFVEIGFGGFVGVVDAVGGVRICPSEPMQDPQAKLDIRAGCQQADGATALGYARSRKTSELGDVDRARRQREVVSAVGAAVASPVSVLNPVRYVRLNTAGAEAVAVGEGTGPVDMARFAWAMTRVGGEAGLTCGVPIVDLAVTWDAERSQQLFGHLIEDNTEAVPDELCTPSGFPPGG